jgi:acetyl-CoA acetyltransferase
MTVVASQMCADPRAALAVDQLHARRVVVTMCTAGGAGTATILQRGLRGTMPA